MSPPTWSVGQVLLKAGSQQAMLIYTWFVPLAVNKGSAQHFTNTTLTNDSQLVVSVAANATYDVKVFMTYTGAAFNTGDLKVFFTVPASAAYTLVNLANNTGGASPGNDVSRLSWSTGTTFNCSSEGATARCAEWFGTLTTAGTSGNFQAQEAQLTLNGVTDTIVGVGSSMVLWRTS